jgi:hypothetical protein
MLDCHLDEELRSEGLAREVINRVQKLRKKAGIQPGNPVEVFYSVGNVTGEKTSEKTSLSPAALSEAIVARELMIFSATKLHVVSSMYALLVNMTNTNIFKGLGQHEEGLLSIKRQK